MSNKAFFIIVSGLITIGGVLAVMQFSPTTANAYVSKEEAEQKVSAKFSGEIESFELDESNNIYEVKMAGSDYQYKMEVDAETGDIVHIDKKQSNNNEQVTTVALSNDTQEHEAKSKDDAFISMEKAKNIATDMYPGVVTEMEMDEDDGRYYYEMELVTETGEVELAIHANTGEILYISVDEDDDKVKQANLAENKNEWLSAEEVRSIALEKYAGTIVEFDLEDEDERYIYEVEIRTDKGDVELEIDASTGDFLKVEYDD
ncbi:PepSY domain-containing protein [Gracilibacillus sp. S3-1-1]|uniref:PepSY domain-containing protein n=1 Tax=Gracilibacillus pellucidus TaxID=3095368 RepID=A0ACC6M2I8_9BACI|nr:PepSY domain-containing protein [Gracilibacillus sp. S3-1-1]MDX8045157.1 PepSY domain-containing protein [Gracilibacillus sp. S3-1-1]